MSPFYPSQALYCKKAEKTLSMYDRRLLVRSISSGLGQEFGNESTIYDNQGFASPRSVLFKRPATEEVYPSCFHPTWTLSEPLVVSPVFVAPHFGYSLTVVATVKVMALAVTVLETLVNLPNEIEHIWSCVVERLLSIIWR